MRIVVHGQQAFGKAVLEALIDRGENVVGVFCAPDKPGRPEDPLKTFARERGLRLGQPKSWKKPEVWEDLAALKPDLCVMAYVTLLVPQTALDLPTHGTIQYHPSLLPKHRGPSSINWAIIQGDDTTGLTIFWPDEKLDEGPILLQREVAIEPDDTLGSLYFGKLFPMGVEAMCEAVDLVRAGKAPKIPQDHSQATYEGWCRPEDVEIDWSRPVKQVYDLIRGANPQPGAWTRCDTDVLQIFDCRRLPAGPGQPGEIVAVEADAFVVAAQGGAIRVMRVRPQGGEKMAAGDYVAMTGLKAGSRLG